MCYLLSIRAGPRNHRQHCVLCCERFRKKPPQVHLRRDGRVVEGARLESVFRGNSNVGSNPTLSASLLSMTYEQA